MVKQQQNIEKFNYGCRVYDFMRWNCIIFSMSAILLIASIAIIATNGFNWGVDFIGGTLIELHLEKLTDLGQIRMALKDLGFTDPVVQNFGSSRNVIIRISPIQNKLDQELSNKLLEVINQATGHNATVKRVEFIGPSVSSILAQDSGIALLIALICIMIYVTIRFEWRLATGAVLALVHDVVITLGILSLFYMVIDLTIVASIISVIGYSLNDSIVVLDRIRENFRKIRYGCTYDILNLSLTQSMSRTIITSVTTLMVVVVLFVFGGEILRGFSTALFIGVLVGTISSIYIAAALAFRLGMRREHLLLQKVE